MKKLILISLLIGALPLSMVAQDDDLYFVPKKKSAVEKVTGSYGLPRETYYSGSNRSVDDYNRRMSRYEPIDSASSDIIDFNGELGVYPDSLDDFNLTKKMERFDDYSLSDNEAYWAGYQQARSDLLWHSPWYYRTYGWYNWYDPWYYTSLHLGLYDPWYYGPYSWYYSGWYGGWYGGWWDPWYNSLYYGYYWGYPYYGYNYAYYGVGGRSLRSYNDHAGTINMHSGNMNGRVYSSANAGSARNSASSRLGAQRTSNLRERTVGNHTTYNRNTNTRITNTNTNTNTRTTTTYTPSNTSSGSSIGGGGFSGGGGRASSGGGGGGGRSAGGHVGGRR